MAPLELPQGTIIASRISKLGFFFVSDREIKRE